MSKFREPGSVMSGYKVDVENGTFLVKSADSRGHSENVIHRGSNSSRAWRLCDLLRGAYERGQRAAARVR